MENNLIPLDDCFTLESDKYAWNLHFRKEGEVNPDTGKPVITQWVHYHGHIKFALEDYMDAALKPAADVVQLLQKINLVENRILTFKNRKL